MSGPKVSIVPLGGYGEVGKNSTAIECEEDIVVIDGGLMFPHDDMPGIDLVIPESTYLVENKSRVRGIVLTHGHEDHIGGLPYLLPKLDAPVYATKLTQGLLSSKLREHGLTPKQVLLRPGETLRLGRIEVEGFHVDHSMPDCVGLALHTRGGTIVHSGDFKFDQTPVDGVPTDFAKLAELGNRGVLALICDCVRVERPGYTPSEKVITESFDRIFFEAQGRVLITTFASNISRIQQALYMAYRYGRKVAFVGRSLESNVTVASDLGYLDVPEDTVVTLEKANRLPPVEVVLVVTGSQGEPTSVLSRIANEDHRQIKAGPGDTVIISASPVPGNEQMVFRTIDNLFRRGAEVVYNSLRPVHVSGHASQEELKMMLNMVRPRYCIPFHGDYRHMILFQKLAAEVGFAGETVFLPENGQTVEFTDGAGRYGETVPAGSVLVDGLSIGDVGQPVLRDRRQLSEDGVILVSVVVDRHTGKVLGGPEITSRGFIYLQEGDGFVDEARDRILASLDHGSPHGSERGFVSQKVKETLGRFVFERTRRKPMILPIVTEV
ncbi:MAG: ribonuclease J [Chloroflexota bacterium]